MNVARFTEDSFQKDLIIFDRFPRYSDFDARIKTFPKDASLTVGGTELDPIKLGTLHMLKRNIRYYRRP